MPVEAALMAMCRAVDEPFACYHVDSTFKDGWIGSNAEWLRDDSTVVVVVVTDEGDSSELNVGGLLAARKPRQMSTCRHLPSSTARSSLLRSVQPWSAMTKVVCVKPPAATSCTRSRTGAMRLKNLADATGGFYNGITVGGDSGDGSETCTTAFADNLADLGALWSICNHIRTQIRARKPPSGCMSTMKKCPATCSRK